MFIKTYLANGKRKGRGFSLVELMISIVLFSLVSLTVMAVYLDSTKSFAILASYAQLDQENRDALDTMTRELRSAQTVTTNTASSISFVNEYGTPVTYSFQSAKQLLIRRATGSPDQVLLTNVNLMSFSVGIRVPNTNFALYPWPTNEPSSAIKAVWLSWKAQRTVPGLENTVSEDVQTAKVVIRAAGTGGL